MVIEFDTYRYHGHSMSDPGSTYRTRDEISSMRQQRDPLEHMRKLILDHNLADASDLKKIEKVRLRGLYLYLLFVCTVDTGYFISARVCQARGPLESVRPGVSLLDFLLLRHIAFVLDRATCSGFHHTNGCKSSSEKHL